MRCLLDTNVLVSGLFTGTTPPGRLVDLWLDGAFDLVTSEHQLREIRRVLTYPRIADRLDSERVNAFLEALHALGPVPDAGCRWFPLPLIRTTTRSSLRHRSPGLT